MAEVAINGKPLGILWKPPYRVEITDAVKAGDNSLEVRVVNLWVNRLIGDEQLPDDGQWEPLKERYAVGRAIKEWPAWLLEGKPSPTGRLCFTNSKYWDKDSPLQPFGLLGPVRLRAAVIRPCP